MSLRAATVTFGEQGPVIEAAPALPLEALVLGRPIAEVVELLPRIFNLCRAAQGAAARLSLGFAPGDGLEAETIRDHVLKLCITLPQAFGSKPLAIPADPAALLGPEGLPADLAGLPSWESPAAALVGLISDSFAPGVACCAELPAPVHPLAEGAFENSAAGRQASHPLLRSVEASHGRGPLWRYLGLLADLEAALQGRLPPPKVEDGVATVPAARGSYALCLRQTGGHITGIVRRTPTDHMLAPGGALVQSLRSLRPAMHRHAGVLALHDPCVPVTVREAAHA
ncbi:MAG: hypothetical protein F9K19_19195 [Rhizobiaceae bacterium]|nr:MAG: hypothetical protein F9K19_19195 [Rhizobiaceae bacterium]CAG1010151.1 hypothetical protein RHIZO_03726 [Rhizobiaceae bacterium]